MRLDQLQALLNRAAHAATPVEEARSCGVLAARAITNGSAELCEPGTMTRLRAAELLLALARAEDEARDHAGQKGSPRQWVDYDEPAAASKPPAKPRTIRAKYAGNCRHCREAYSEGEKVLWEQGRGCAHLGCVAERDSRAA